MKPKLKELGCERRFMIQKKRFLQQSRYAVGTYYYDVVIVDPFIAAILKFIVVDTEHLSCWNAFDFSWPKIGRDKSFWHIQKMKNWVKARPTNTITIRVVIQNTEQFSTCDVGQIKFCSLYWKICNSVDIICHLLHLGY